MIITIPWLKEHLNTKANEPEIINQLTNIGLEVEGVKESSNLLSDFKVAKILKAEKHPNADKLYVVTIEDGPESTRTVCAGLKGIYEKDQLLGKQVVFVANLKPRKLRGIMSEGMILAADDGDGKVSVLTLDSDMPTGSQVR